MAHMTQRIYLDHAATTPVSAAVLAAMTPYFGSYNPSSLHAEGRAARAAIDGARSAVARCIGAKPREIVFTSGGSEANNLALIGAARAARASPGDAAHVVTVATEHHAVLHAARVLADEGFAVTLLPVDADGVLHRDVFAAALRSETVLAAVMLANNETGTLQPVAELARIARRRDVRFHTDAVQAPGRLAIDVAELGVDFLALSAHKCAGPKGVGALYVRGATPLTPIVVGGAQEAGRRAGTEDVAGLVGFARALTDTTAELETEPARLRSLRDRFETVCLRRIAQTRVNGAGAARLPNVSSIAFAGVAAADLLVRLDLAGIAISSGSACAAGSPEPSHVVAALQAEPWVRAGTVRFSFGRSTTGQDVDRVVETLAEIVGAIRVASGYLGKPLSGSPTHSLEVRF